MPETDHWAGLAHIGNMPTPCYVVDKDLLEANLRLLRDIALRTGCRILLAQKAFSMFSLYPLVGKYLSGTTASSLYEARLGREEMGGETHIFAPAYRADEFPYILDICGHIVFNSFGQWRKYKDAVKACGRRISCGIRVNPEYSEIETDIYNPCFQNSRLGVTLRDFEEGWRKEAESPSPDGAPRIEGLHFHTMCEQNSDTLRRTLDVVLEKFGAFLPGFKWVNFGGGHHITRPDYDVETLVRCIEQVRDAYGVTVYLEPGEAVALNTGFLVAEVLDIVKNGMEIALLNTSAACHMPDVLEMPYRPHIIGAGLPGELAHTYRLGGPTCLAGDVIGDYSFDKPLTPGTRLVFCDMAHYTMVKNNTFNGIGLPAIGVFDQAEGYKTVKAFGYEDFKGRLS